MPPKRKYITKRTIEEFNSPDPLPSTIEEEILQALTGYSIEHDMNTDDLPQYYKDLEIPNVFIVNNSRLDPKDLVIEGTDIIDFEKMMIVSYHLILFRNNKDLIQNTWQMLLSELRQKENQTTIDVSQLLEINDTAKVGIATPLLLDMMALATDGKSVSMSIVDFAYVMGKLSKLGINE